MRGSSFPQPGPHGYQIKKGNYSRNCLVGCVGIIALIAFVPVCAIAVGTIAHTRFPFVPAGSPFAEFPSPIAESPTPTPLPEQLTFTGSYKGKMTTGINPGKFGHSDYPEIPWEERPAQTRCAAWSYSADPTTSYWQADIVGAVNGATWALSLGYGPSRPVPPLPHKFSVVQSFEGAQGYAVLWTPLPTRFDSFAVGSRGSFTLAADMSHGTIDVFLPGRDASGEFGALVHVIGQWRCA